MDGSDTRNKNCQRWCTSYILCIYKNIIYIFASDKFSYYTTHIQCPNAIFCKEYCNIAIFFRQVTCSEIEDAYFHFYTKHLYLLLRFCYPLHKWCSKPLKFSRHTQMWFRLTRTIYKCFTVVYNLWISTLYFISVIFYHSITNFVLLWFNYSIISRSISQSSN